MNLEEVNDLREGELVRLMDALIEKFGPKTTLRILAGSLCHKAKEEDFNLSKEYFRLCGQISMITEDIK